MVQLANGSKLHIGRAGTVKADFESVTRGASTIFNLSTTGFKIGDTVMIQNASNSLLEGAVGLVSAGGSNGLTVLGIDTSDTDDYASDEVIMGTVVRVDSYAALPLTSEIAVSGGDATSASIQFIQENKARSFNTGSSASVVTLTMAQDELSAVIKTLKAITKTQENVVYRVYNPRARSGVGEYRYMPATAFFNDIPQMSNNNVETNTLVFTLQNSPLMLGKDQVDGLVSGS
ncbi:MAG: hypothetical protein [Bacteriophage sp.]|nr:MAG: hypothetical protein [Bacteriophage sp.]